MALNGGIVRWRVEADLSDFNKGLDSATRNARNLGKTLDESMKKSSKDPFEGHRRSINGVTEALSGASRGYASLRAAGADLFSPFAQSANLALNSITALTGGIATLIATQTRSGIEGAEFVAKNNASFISLTGSIESANDAMAQAFKFYKGLNKNSVGSVFSRFPTISAVNSILKYGTAVEDITEKLELLGRVSIASGVGLDELAEMVGRATSQKTFGLFEYDQLVQRVPALNKELAKHMNVAVGDVRAKLNGTRSDTQLLIKALEGVAANGGLAMEKFTATLEYQSGRAKGRLADIGAALVGYSVDAQRGFVAVEKGMYKSVVRMTKIFADTLAGSTATGQKMQKVLSRIGEAIAPIIDKIADSLPAAINRGLDIIDKFAGALEKLSQKIVASGFDIKSLIPIFFVLGTQILGFVGSITGGADGLLGALGGVGQAVGGVSLPIVLLAATFMKALMSSEKLRDSLGQLMASLGNLAAVFFNAFSKLASSGFVINTLTFITQALTLLTNVVASFPTPILQGVILAMIGGAVISKLIAFGRSIGLIAANFLSLGKAATVAKATTGISNGFLTLAGSLAKALPVILKASAAIAALGGAIGFAIGAVGGGIWVFGKGISALGKSFMDLAEGAKAIQRTDFSKFGPKLAQLASGFQGLSSRILDLGAAALTLPSIGLGLVHIAHALKTLGKTNVNEIDKKIPAIAKALRSFSVGDFKTNVLSKFKDLGDSIHHVAQLIDTVSNIRINSRKLQSTMSDIGQGLKAFLIPEFEPSFLGKIFGTGHIKPASVLQYMKGLSGIIEPLRSFSSLVSSAGFDSFKMMSSMENLGRGLRAFLIEEIQPSFIQKIFGTKNIKISSVTEKLGGLSELITQLDRFQALFKSLDLKADNYTTFVGDVGKALQSFLTADIQEKSFKLFSASSDSIKITRRGVTEFFDGFANVITGLEKLSALSGTDNFDGNKFTQFIANVGAALQAFLVEQVHKTSTQLFGSSSLRVEKRGVTEFFGGMAEVITGLERINKLASSDGFDGEKFAQLIRGIGQALHSFLTENVTKHTQQLFSSSSVKIEKKSVLDFFDGFANVLSGLERLNSLSKSDNFDSDKFVDLIGKVGTALKAFTATDTKKKFSKFLGDSGEVEKHTKGIIDFFKDFDKFVTSLSNLYSIIAAKDFDLNKFVYAINRIGQSLNVFTKENVHIKNASIAGQSGEYSKSYDNMINHMKDFKNFADGLVILLNLFGKGNEIDLIGFDAAMSRIAQSLSAFNLQNNTVTDTIANILEHKSQVSHTSIFAHLGDFRNFAEGLAIFIQAISAKDFNVSNFERALGAIAQSLRSLMLKETEISWSVWGISNNEKVNYKSVMDHLGNFKDFAINMGDLAKILGAKDFNADGFKASINAIFSGLAALKLKEEEVSKNGWFSNENTKVSYSSVVEKVKDLDRIVKAVAEMKASGILGDAMFTNGTFSTTMQAISNGLKHLLQVGEISTEGLDTSKISGIATGVKAIRESVNGWDTSTLATTAHNVADFIAQIAASIRTGFEAKVQDMVNLGKLYVQKLFEGMLSNKHLMTNAAGQLQGEFWLILQNKSQDHFYQGQDYVNKFIDGINSKQNDVGNAANTIGTNFVNGIRAVKGYYESGHNAISGFISGVESRNVHAVGWWVAEKFLRGLRERAGEHSPWKTTFKSGQFAAEGLAEGVKRSERSVLSAASSLVENVTDILSMEDVSIAPTFSASGTLAPSVYSEREAYGNPSRSRQVIVNQTNNNYTQVSVDQLVRDLRWELRKA